MTGIVLGLLMIIFVVFIVYVAMGVKIVRPYQKGVVEQLGRYKGTVEPGLRLIYPFIHRLRTVDMREQVIDVPPQEVITQDNVAVSVDAVVYFEPTDPSDCSTTSRTSSWPLPSWPRPTCVTSSVR